jgi:hypothetical protein
VQGLGDDQDVCRLFPDGRQAALPVRPAAGVHVPRRVGEDHLAGRRMLGIAAERHVVLVTGRVPDLDAAGDRGDVQDRHRDGEGQRDRVAQVDERVQPRERSLLAEPAQQRLRGTPVLGGLESHPRERAAPCLDLRHLALWPVRQPGPRDGQELLGPAGRIGRDVTADPGDVKHPGNQFGEVTPDLIGMLELH